MGSVPTLREVLEQAQADGTGVGHFKVSDLIGLKAVFEAARARNVSVPEDTGRRPFGPAEVTHGTGYSLSTSQAIDFL